MKKLVRNLLNRYGYDVVRIRNSNADLSEHLSNVINSKKIDCVIDVGANAGQYGEFLRGIGYRGKIISFEPVSAVFKVLRSKCEGDSEWFAFNCALGDKEEEKVINVYKSTVFSSFLTANNYSKSIWRSLENVTHETVRVSRLDKMWPDIIGNFGCNNYMLKMDTQGFDKFVFDGARGCLSNVSVLQSELSMIPVYDGMVQVYDVLKEFHSHGFFISGLYPINRDKSLAVIEYDCVLVRRLPGVLPGK